LPYKHSRADSLASPRFPQPGKCDIISSLEAQKEVPAVAPPKAKSPGRVSWLFLGLALGVLWFICCRHLSAEWRFNEQYSYGWFVPFFALYLLWLRWEDRPRESEKAKVESRRWKTGNWVAILVIITAALILLPLRVFEIANPDWRPLGWIHAFTALTVTLAIIYLIRGAPGLRHFAFPVCFILTAVPWPTPIEAPIVQGLMRGIAAAAAETVSLFGIPAEVQGNLIHLPNGVVGVNEACSGVRSLQTSLMIGLLFGELQRLTFAKRVVLVLSAIAIALLANFGRSLFLVTIAARQNIAAVGKWHDFAGYAIVALVFAGTMWTAKKLGSRKAKVENGAATTPHFPSRTPHSFLLSPFSFLLLFWFLAVEVAAESWYRVHERDSIVQPRWTIHWPESAADFRDLKIDEGIRDTLRYDTGREAFCKIPLSNQTDARTFLFFFRWSPGDTSTVLRARAHRPDICLPAAGWEQIADKGYENIPVGSGLILPVRRVTFAQQRTGIIAHTYFCLQEDTANPRDTRSDLDARNGAQPDWGPKGRWRIALDGIRNRGQQVLEVIMIAPKQIADAEVDQEFAKLLKQLVNG
jgi:exosortase